jgi:hypothetical protein
MFRRAALQGVELRPLGQAIAIVAVTGWNFYLNFKLSWRAAEPE